MTDKIKSKSLTMDGALKHGLAMEGYVQKGGVNTFPSQVKVRPPAPASMKAAKPGAAKPNGGGD